MKEMSDFENLRDWKRTAFYLGLVMNEGRHHPSPRLALWLHTHKLLVADVKPNVMSCKFQGKYMQLSSLVHRLSGVKEKTVKWQPLIKVLVGRAEEEGQMK